MRAFVFFISALTMLNPVSVHAEATRPANLAPAVGSGGILQVAFSLLLVLVVIVLVAWLLKRMNVTPSGNGNQLKVLGGIAIGQRERVVLVEIENTWLVVGVGPGQIRTLHTLPKSTSSNDSVTTPTNTVPFNVWLKKIIEKRDAT
ncbi:MAG: flagellar biosynthetic protein FliO [Gallionella sp.]